MSPRIVEKAIPAFTVNEPKKPSTVSYPVASKTTQGTLNDTFKKNNSKPVNIFGAVPVNRQIIFPDKPSSPNGKKVTNTSENTSDPTKDLMNGVSVAADGLGTIFEKFDFISVKNIDAINIFHSGLLDRVDLNFLDGIDVLGVQSLKFVATGFRIGVNYKDLSNDLKKNDARNTAWDVLGLTKTTWSLLQGGVNTASASASFGMDIGMNTARTAATLGTEVKCFTGIANKLAVPFAIANTGMQSWDLIDDNKKVVKKEAELARAISERQQSSKNSNIKTKVTETTKEKELKKEIGVLKTNTKIMGVAFGLSSVSTAALIASVVFPESAKITIPVSMASNAVSSVVRSLSDDTLRTKIVSTYGVIRTQAYQISNDVNRFLVR